MFDPFVDFYHYVIEFFSWCSRHTLPEIFLANMNGIVLSIITLGVCAIGYLSIHHILNEVEEDEGAEVSDKKRKGKTSSKKNARANESSSAGDAVDDLMEQRDALISGSDPISEIASCISHGSVDEAKLAGSAEPGLEESDPTVVYHEDPSPSQLSQESDLVDRAA